MLNELADKIHENAVTHGWWEEERNFGEIIALCHSELSEALEEARANAPMEYIVKKRGERYEIETDMAKRVEEKTEGIAVELGDCIIRILDYLATTGIDIDAMIARKMAYNENRPYKHGKQF